MNFNYIFLLVFCLAYTSCKNDPSKTSNISETPKPKAIIPKVDGDSAYHFIEKQLSFGVRVPGTQSHIQTKDWIVQKMKTYGAEIKIQEFTTSFLTVKNVKAYNIIASINPEKEKRVALFAHWDSRLIAEKDKNSALKDKPIPGAIDGGSGVAVLLEIARQLKLNPIDLGVDFVFFDAEDQGNESLGDSWCLGSQYWAKSVKDNKSKPEFGILLDLVGAKGATYSKEEISARMAGGIQNKIWALASAMGKGNLFINSPIGAITDDHYYVTTIAGIPTVDIIETKPSGYFSDYHHTHNDNLDALDKDNLASVIQVVLAVIYKSSDDTF
jgi:Zn-dependent M28 family amino/carboxypeptidase